MTDFSQNFILKGLTKPNAQTEREGERERQRERDPTKGTRRTTSARWMSSVWTKSLRPLLNNHTRPHVCLTSNFNGFSLCEVYSDVDFPFVNVTCKTTHFSLREKKRKKMALSVASTRWGNPPWILLQFGLKKHVGI